MHKILALETSTEFGSVALLADRSVLCECGFGGGITHTERMLPAIEWVLGRSRVRRNEISAVAVGIGPGSFTGLRIGLTTGKGLAWALQLPLIGISSLQALTANLSSSLEDICSMLDARKGELYWGRYRFERGTCVSLADERVSPLRRAYEEFPGPAVFIGTGAVRYRSEIESLWGERARFADPLDAFPRAGRTGLLAWERLSRGEHDDLRTLLPHYLRKSEAEMARPEISLEALKTKGGNPNGE